MAQTFIVGFFNGILRCGEFHLAKIHNLVNSVNDHIYLRAVAIYWIVFYSPRIYLC